MPLQHGDWRSYVDPREAATHPTQCVAECAKCRFSGQANTIWGPPTDRSNGPQFNMAVRITSEHTCARNAQARIRAIVWYTTRWDWRIGIGCAMAAECWVWANEISIFFPRRDQCLTHVLTRKFARTQISLRNDQRKTASPRAVKVLFTNAWLKGPISLAETSPRLPRLISRGDSGDSGDQK